MSKSRIKKLTTLAKTKFLSLYDLEYEDKKGKTRNWTMASRKSFDTLSGQYFHGKKDNPDASIIAALHEESNKIVCIRQFRVPLNDYIYELPAGLIDKGEKFDEAAKRELREETGLELVKIDYEKTNKKVYASAGMTDESSALVFCTCKGQVSDKYLEAEEEIEVVLLSQEEVKELLKQEEVKIDMRAFILLQAFVQLGEKMFK
ncbi:NUDIX hydrolase [Clostridium arbusti]|uniref:NUDIX hydrolase n=1 Tax=Clostridium arbusti TaxID=1137848 RepID=UPI0002888E55|nr:NUDIX hydrolase [Clostridium arbusti]